MKTYRGVSLVVVTASLFICGLVNAQDQPSGPSAPTETSTDATSSSVTEDQSAAAKAPASSTKSTSNEDLKMASTVYIWMPGIHGSLGAFGYNFGYKASPGELLSDADFGIMTLYQVQYKKLVVLLDFFWTPLTVDKARSVTLAPNAPLLTTTVGLSSQLKYTETMIAPEFGYRLIDNPKIKVDALMGFRYWYNGYTANVTTVANGLNHYHTSASYTDPVIGARIQVPLSPKIVATIQGDTGGWGAGSQLEYQMVGALAYKFTPKWAVNAAWRYNYIDYGTIVKSKIAMSGFVIGGTYVWKGAE